MVVPTFNRPGLVGRAIASALAQTVSDIEVIVVDDAPSEETRAAVGRFADARVRYLAHERNRGPSASRNTGIAAARGRLIAFLDDDDEWLPTKIEKQLAYLERERLDAAAGIGLIDGKVPLRYRGARVTLEELRRGNRWGSCTFIGRAEAVRDVLFDEELTVGEDWDFYIRFARKYTIGCLLEPLFIYHQAGTDAAPNRLLRGAQAMSPTELEERIGVLRKHREFFGEWWYRFHFATALLSHIGSRPDRGRYLQHAIRRCGLMPVAAVMWDKVSWRLHAQRARSARGQRKDRLARTQG
ncbi:MAG TPA: glycosyltransferase family 2 protein [Burkholderiales bacterium]